MTGTSVLIVGTSDVTTVVVAKIIERSGLRAVCSRPDGAAELLRRTRPQVIVLDGGADNRECDALKADIVALRQADGGRVPAVLLLSNRNGAPHGMPDIVDAVVAKPITPESIQPVVDRLLAGT